MLASLLILAAFCVSFPTSFAQTNLLRNGDFEMQFEDPSDVPEWTEIPVDTNTANVFIQDFGGENDNGNALFLGSIDQLAGVYQNVSLAPNTQFPLSWSLLVVGPQNRFQVEAICAGQSQVLFNEVRLDDTQGAYERRTVYLTTSPGNAPVSCSIRFVGRLTAFSNFLLDNVLLSQPSTVGDPVFVGFAGQVYQVHGIPGRIFNIISTANVQLNAQFKFLGRGESMTQTEMRAVRAQVDGFAAVDHIKTVKPLKRTLPVTTAWSHDGTYLGAMAMQFKSADQIIRLQLVPGAYQKGMQLVEVDEKRINVENAAYPLVVVNTHAVKVNVISPHVVEITTPELVLVIVNSDNFFNIQSARLLGEVQKNPSLIQGILGQSADAKRYFPKYEPSSHAAGAEKNDWNQHQIMDYLIADDNLWSGEFTLNRFEISH